MKLIIYTDGASRGNPGPASYGFTIQDEKGNLLHQKGAYIGITTNNVAEYSAVLYALKYILEKFSANLPLSISCYADSQLVASQLSGQFKIKSQRLKPLILQIRNIEKVLGQVEYTHVRRHLNQQADQLANLALDNQLKLAS